MAWQLVYTSAPRLLDAGRSGFGTVARHRDIPPMVVQAVERMSQFARLPGTDPGRVIYSHRVVALAGTRYHVLSMIRNAGADYTGRTNHIAHHLIATQREASECEALGICPADVLVGYPWLDTWARPPRSFDASEEVALTSLPHVTLNTSLWDHLTGDPDNVLLLVTNPASRSCQLIAPAGTDFRLLFIESLRWHTGSTWQVTFTTSAEPGEDPGDFRWIGSIGGVGPAPAPSGRPVLDLTHPESLPKPEHPRHTEPNPSIIGSPTSRAILTQDVGQPNPHQYGSAQSATFAEPTVLPAPNQRGPETGSHSRLPKTSSASNSSQGRQNQGPLATRTGMSALILKVASILFLILSVSSLVLLWQRKRTAEIELQNLRQKLGASQEYYGPGFLRSVTNATTDPSERIQLCSHASKLYNLFVSRSPSIPGLAEIGEPKKSLEEVDTLDAIRKNILKLFEESNALAQKSLIDLHPAIAELTKKTSDFQKTLPLSIAGDIKLNEGIELRFKELLKSLTDNAAKAVAIAKHKVQEKRPANAGAETEIILAIESLKRTLPTQTADLQAIENWLNADIALANADSIEKIPTLGGDAAGWPEWLQSAIKAKTKSLPKQTLTPIPEALPAISAPLAITPSNKTNKGTLYLIADISDLKIPIPKDVDVWFWKKNATPDQLIELTRVRTEEFGSFDTILNKGRNAEPAFFQRSKEGFLQSNKREALKQFDERVDLPYSPRLASTLDEVRGVQVVSLTTKETLATVFLLKPDELNVPGLRPLLGDKVESVKLMTQETKVILESPLLDRPPVIKPPWKLKKYKLDFPEQLKIELRLLDIPSSAELIVFANDNHLQTNLQKLLDLKYQDLAGKKTATENTIRDKSALIAPSKKDEEQPSKKPPKTEKHSPLDDGRTAGTKKEIANLEEVLKTLTQKLDLTKSLQNRLLLGGNVSDEEQYESTLKIALQYKNDQLVTIPLCKVRISQK